MLIDIININAEEKLLALLEQANRQNLIGGALMFRCSHLPQAPGEDDLLLTVRPALEDKSSSLYFFAGGDVVVTWKGPQKSTVADLRRRLYERYAPGASESLDTYFDLQAHAEELRRLCKRGAPPSRLPSPLPVAPAPQPALKPLAFSERQSAAFRAAAGKRKERATPEMLMVEDDPFSSRLLLKLLSESHRVFAAASAAEGIDLYATHAPDMVFLDIQLPDMDGHHLAALVRKLDPDAHIVMVTGNNFAQDVLRAKENGVKGFVAKPYNKQKIQSLIEAFVKNRQA